MNFKLYFKIQQVVDQFYDFIYNVETCKLDLLEDNRKIHYNYWATNYSELIKVFMKHPFSCEDHIVDFGCGKGRVLIMAALNSCKYVTGIEINKRMYNIAEKNIESFRRRYKAVNTDFNLYNMDACDFIIADNMNVFFFFDPFHLKIFIKIMNNILKSLERNERKITLFFYMPDKLWFEYLESLETFKNIDTINNKNYKLLDYCYGSVFSVFSNILT